MAGQVRRLQSGSAGCDLVDVSSDRQQAAQIGDLGQKIVDRSVREADGGTQRAAALLVGGGERENRQGQEMCLPVPGGPQTSVQSLLSIESYASCWLGVRCGAARVLASAVMESGGRAWRAVDGLRSRSVNRRPLSCDSATISFSSFGS